MSDNVTQLEPMPKDRTLLRRIVIFAVIVVAVCASVALLLFSEELNMDSLRRWVKYMNVRDDGTYGVYAFDSHSGNRYGVMDSGLAVASVGGLNTYGENGEEVAIAQAQLSVPQLQVSEELAVAYDVGGTTLLAVNRSGSEVLRVEEEKPILDAAVTQSGYICYSGSASGYKSVLSVYNQKQERIYRWLSSTTYMPLCALAENGRDLAAIGLNQAGGVFESTLYLFQTNSEELPQAFPLGNQLIYDLMFVDEDVLCAVGETSLQLLTLDGTVLGAYSYEDRYLKDYDDGGNGFLALTVNMYKAGNRYSLVTVNEQGEELANVYIGREILDLSACGKYIAVLTTEGLTIYTQSLSVYHETAETGTATAVVMREDGSVLLLGNGEGHLYIP